MSWGGSGSGGASRLYGGRSPIHAPAPSIRLPLLSESILASVPIAHCSVGHRGGIDSDPHWQLGRLLQRGAAAAPQLRPISCLLSPPPLDVIGVRQRRDGKQAEAQRHA